MSGNAIRYFLVAQDYDGENFDIVSLSPSDYVQGGDNQLERHHKLEEIDLFTTRFTNEQQLVHYLYQNGRISNDQVRLFIAFQSKKESRIKRYEALYNRDNRSDINDLCSMAFHDLGYPRQNSLASEAIMARFCETLRYNDSFYDVIACGLTDIYGDFLDFLKSKHYYQGLEDIKRFKGGWALRSYSLMRNIVAAYDQYQLLQSMGGNILEVASLLEKSKDRNLLKISDKLAVQLDPDYDPNQLSLFDFLPEAWEESSPEKIVVEGSKKSPSKLSTKKSSTKKPKFRVSDIPTHSEVPMAKKRAYVMDTLRNLLPFCFNMTGTSSAQFRLDTFSCPIDELDQMRLERYLDSYSRLHFYLYNRYSSLLEQEKSRPDAYSSDISELSHDASMEHKTINHYLFGHDEALNRAYAWCTIYNRYAEVDKNYQEDEAGKGGAYVKKNDGRGKGNR